MKLLSEIKRIVFFFIVRMFYPKYDSYAYRFVRTFYTFTYVKEYQCQFFNMKFASRPAFSAMAAFST